MYKHLIILGTGGCAREAYWHVKQTNPSMRIVFVDDITDITSVMMGDTLVPVIKNWRFIDIKVGEEVITFDSFIVGVGAPLVKKLFVAKAIKYGLHPAPTIIHPRALVQGDDCQIGIGGIITPGCIITTNVTIGDYVILNLNTTIGHDTIIGDYVTSNPGCSISGNVTLGEAVFLGTGTVIREKTVIAEGVVTGAQACIVNNIDESGVIIGGVPARKL